MTRETRETIEVQTITKQLPVRMDEDIYNQLKALAFLTGRSMNSMITEAVNGWLEGEGREQLVAAASRDGRVRYRVILDKLKDL